MKRIMNILFVAIFFLCLVLPAVTMEFGKGVQSEIDNAYLPELEFETFAELEESLTDYVDKRIGFRKESLWMYQRINDMAFSMMEHPTYMYGQNDHVYFKGTSYMRHYQHLNLDEEYADSFAEALRGFHEYAEHRDSIFLYFYLPDKETVYPEYYPDTVNVYGDVSFSDQILNALEKKGVPYLFAKDAMQEGKKDYLVNNKKYDAGHWNDHGAFVSIRQLFEELKEFYPQIQSLKQEEFILGTKTMKSLLVSNFEINEEVPVYSLKETAAINQTEALRERAKTLIPENYVCRYVNPECMDQPKLLIFGDSYLAGYDCFFINHFSEYTYIPGNSV